jgi:LysM repeat protein
MKEEPEIGGNPSSEEEDQGFQEGEKSGFSRSRVLFVILTLGVIGLIAAAVFYISTGSQIPEDTQPARTKMTALQQKIALLEKQVEDLSAKVAAPAGDSDLAQRLKELGQKVEMLEKSRPPAAVNPKPATPKPAVSPPAKPAASNAKQYHNVQKGDTLFAIAKKYKISVSELSKLNNLGEKQTIFSGQKLVVSQGR